VLYLLFGVVSIVRCCIYCSVLYLLFGVVSIVRCCIYCSVLYLLFGVVSIVRCCIIYRSCLRSNCRRLIQNVFELDEIGTNIFFIVTLHYSCVNASTNPKCLLAS